MSASRVRIPPSPSRKPRSCGASRLIRFSDGVHRPILTAGPGRFLRLPLWHADPILRTFEERLEKARRYERARPGMRVAGRALNVAFYVPEARPDPPLAPVPDDEREHIESVLRAEPPTGPPRATIETVSRAEIDRLWPVTDPGAQAGRLELLEHPSTLYATEQRTRIDVCVHNAGSATWPWGSDGLPEVRVGSRWYDPEGRELLLEYQVHSVFAGPIAPGEADVVPVHVRVPEMPGQYRVEIDLIEQHVRWFEAAVSLEVAVREQRRIAVVGDDDRFAEMVRILEEIPELELVPAAAYSGARPRGLPGSS